MSVLSPELRQSLLESENRRELWIRFINALDVRTMAEIGVLRGEFAAAILRACPLIQQYVMIDPWRHLDGWNKPANVPDETFAQYRAEALAKTECASSRRLVLDGTTSEVISLIPDNSLDLAYIDGDHTLRGITIDLIRVLPKVREGGWIGGDDLVPSIWQHCHDYEPTLVFPFVVFFAEACDYPIVALPHNQFLIRKTGGFNFEDLVGQFGNTSLRDQCQGGHRKAPGEKA